MKNRITGYNKGKVFKRLLKDQSGNAIIFIGASLIPLLALVGGGVDASRGYMAKARLQQACDAATLAGRRAVGNGTFDIIAEQQADRLFEANFERGFLGSDPVATTFETSSIDNGNTVRGVATTSIPTVIMDIFGNESLDITVNCEAALDIANADVTMVLDTTGSMSTRTGGRGSITRIQALRNAAKSFYGVLDSASQSSGARIRYGFVPYSSTVNVGRALVNNTSGSVLLGQNAGETHIYSSRRPLYLATAVVDSGNELARFNGQQIFLERSDCALYGVNINRDPINRNTVRSFNSRRQELTSSPIANPGNPVDNGDGTITTYSNPISFGAQFFVGGQLRQECLREFETTRKVVTDDPNARDAEFLRWEYRDLNIPISDYVNSITTGRPVDVPTNLPDGFIIPESEEDRHIGNLPATVWEGCIEERQTVAAAAADFGFNSLVGITPNGALDLDTDIIPNNDASKWRPMWPEIVYTRQVDIQNDQDNPNTTRFFSNEPVTDRGTIANSVCPTESRILRSYTQSEFDSYIDGLTIGGNTYHDIGAIWGSHLTNPDGIFADNVNESAPNNGFVSRNLIYMTDGELVPNINIYSAYGIERLNRRISPDGSDLVNRHNSRFLAVCEAIKAKGTRIFVIAFGTELSTDLQTCASVNSAFSADDSDQLNNTFLQIASNIADLRLTN